MSAFVNGAIMISGRGSNMKALVGAAKDQPDFPVRFSCVLSDKPDAPGLGWAAKHGLDTAIIDPRDPDALTAILERRGVELVCLAGYMRVLPPEFCARWAGRCVNIHPSLLPKHKGLNAQAKALAAQDKRAGATVHWVSDKLDGGEIIMQRAVPVLADDDVERLSMRILTVEHQIYPLAVIAAAREILASQPRARISATAPQGAFHETH